MARGVVEHAGDPGAVAALFEGPDRPEIERPDDHLRGREPAENPVRRLVDAAIIFERRFPARAAQEPEARHPRLAHSRLRAAATAPIDGS